MGREFNSVQTLNRFRKELAQKLAASAAEEEAAPAAA
jgi:hypothetical protein